MKVLIHTLVWKRPEATELTYKGFDRIQERLKESGIDSEVLITSSEPDHTAKAIIRGYNVFEYKNLPVAEKYDAAMHETLNYEWDFLMEMGSNNLLSDDYIKRWVGKCNHNENRFFGSNRFLCLSADRKHTAQFVTPSTNKLTNLGRGVRRDVWERLQDVGLFVPNKERNDGLDTMSNYMAKKFVLGRRGYRHNICKDYDGLLDFKSGEDMHDDSKHVPEKRREKADIPYLIKIFPELHDWM